MLITGTVACVASSRSSSSLPVRRPIAATWREKTSAVSRRDSPRVSCSSLARTIIGWPPSSNTPVSNDERVRVDGCWNISATDRPSSTREDRGAAFSSAARPSSAASVAASSSAPVRKCSGVSSAGIDLEPLPRSQPEARRALAAEGVLGRARRLGMGRRAAAGGAAVVAAGARAGHGRAGADGAHLAQLAAVVAAADLGFEPGHPEVQRRRGERDPRARGGARPPLGRAHEDAGAPGRACGPAGRRLDRECPLEHAPRRMGAARHPARTRVGAGSAAAVRRRRQPPPSAGAAGLASCGRQSRRPPVHERPARPRRRRARSRAAVRSSTGRRGVLNVRMGSATPRAPSFARMLRSVVLGCAVALLAASPAHAADYVVTSLGDHTADGCGAECTLRDAIEAADATAEADTIALPAGTIALSRGALAITGSVAVQGQGTTLDPAYTDRILDVSAGAVTLSRVTLSRGFSQDITGGSALLMRGGIVTLDRVVVTGNSNNLSGGAILQQSGTLAITDSEVRGSHAFRGAGLFIAAGTANIDRTLWLSNDGSTGGGGAIYNNGGTLTVTNSTFADNSANSAHGGAIYAGAGSTTLGNVTFEANAASGNNGGGADIWSDVSVTTSNVLFANSAGGDNCAGAPLTEQGGSMDAARTCGLEVASQPVRLGPLASNGGFARSLLPWAGSAGVNAGADAFCTAHDQRGATRAHSAADHCDVGAVEGTAAIAAPPPVLAAENVTPGAHAARLDATIDRQGLATSYHLDYGPTPAYGQTVPDTVPFGPGAGAQPVGFQFGGLDPGTTYHYRVVATSAAGTVESPDRTFTALAADQIAITGAPAAFITASSVEFRFAPSPGTGELECALTGPGQSGDFAFCADSVSYDLTGDGAYTFTVREPDGAPSATRSFTLDRTPPPPPQLEQTGSETFVFSSEPGSAFECRIDDGPFAPCTSPARFDGLPPGTHIFTVRSTDPAGNASTGSSSRTFTVAVVAQQTPTPTPAPTPTPVPGQTVVGRPVSGKVLVKQPGKGYVELDGTQSIPLGSTIDTRKGTISLTAKTARTATFHDGIFKITQTKTTTDLTLTEPLAACHGARIAAKKPKTRKLWGNGSGSFRTRGQYSAATVRGTEWLVQDSCAGTLTRVKKGVVSVRDNVKNKTIVLRAGKSYLATPRR